MTTKPRTTSTRLDLIEYKLGELQESTKEVNSKLDGLKFASQADFDALKAEVKSTYVTIETFKPYKWVITTIGGAFLGAFATAAAYFIIKGGLQ